MTKKLIYPSFTSARVLPKNFKPADGYMFEMDMTRKFDSSYLFQFNNCIVTDDGVVINNLKVIPESLYHIEAKKYFGWKYVLRTFLQKKKIVLDNQKYLLPFNLWNGYGHWLPEVFPRLFAIKELLSEYIILLPDHLHPQMKAALAPFNFKDVLSVPKNSFLKIPNLTMPAMLADTGNYNDAVMSKLRDFLRDFYKKNITVGKQNIYLSRAKATKRRVDNESDLIPILEKYNFKIIYVETLSFEQQLSLFLNCRNLISLHGGAMANMLYMPAQSNVLEIRNSTNKRDLCFCALASALKIDYYYVLGTSTENSANQRSNADTLIDPNSFEKAISQMLEEKKAITS